MLGAPSLFDRLMAKLVRARRAYYARKRRPLKIEVLGPERVIYKGGKEPPIVIEKEVVRWIDQILLIPRWGIKAPIHVNSLIRRNEWRPGLHPKGDDPVDATSNVTSLKR
jgi:hypothetical protein